MQLMRLAAPQDTNAGSGPVPGWSILASQRYAVQSSGTGIEFSTRDPLYLGGYVTSAMQAVLAIPQEQDPNFAAYLSQGLQAAWSNTNGAVYPAFLGIGALNGYNGKGPTTSYVSCSTCNNYGNDAYGVTLTTIAGACGTQVINFAETVHSDYQYAPLFGQSIQGGLGWLSKAPAVFKGKNNVPSMPFNGPSGNPYLVVSINGSPVDWSSPSSFSGVNCHSEKNQTCTGFHPDRPGAVLRAGQPIRPEQQAPRNAVQPVPHQLEPPSRRPLASGSVGIARRERRRGDGNVLHPDHPGRNHRVRVGAMIFSRVDSTLGDIVTR